MAINSCVLSIRGRRGLKIEDTVPDEDSYVYILVSSNFALMWYAMMTY